MHLVTNPIGGIPLNVKYGNTEGYGPLYTSFMGGTYWTGYDRSYNSSQYAWIVYAYSSTEGVTPRSHEVSTNALCEEN